MLVIIVLITSQRAAEISRRTASGLIDIKSHGEDEDGLREGRGPDLHSQWPDKLGSMTVWVLITSDFGVDFVRLAKNPHYLPV